MSSKPTGGLPPPKKQKVEEEAPTAVPIELSPAERELENLQESLDELDRAAAEEIIALQKTYNCKKKPIYEERGKVIKGIPDFWSKAALNHSGLDSILSPTDTDVLQYLESVNVEDFEDIKLGFRIELRFRPNEWFKNSLLTKEFRFTEDGEFESVLPSKIDWKEGKDLTIQNVDDDDHQESFFSFWFDAQNQDIEVAEMIKEIFASPAKFYHNLVPTSSDLEFDSDEEDDGDEVDEWMDWILLRTVGWLVSFNQLCNCW